MLKKFVFSLFLTVLTFNNTFGMKKTFPLKKIFQCFCCNVEDENPLESSTQEKENSCNLYRHLDLMYKSTYYFNTNINEIDINEIDINAKLFVDGNTILHMACFNGYWLLVKRILKRKTIDVNVKNYLNETPIIMALINGDKNTIAVMLKNSNPQITIEMIEEDYENLKPNYDEETINAIELSLRFVKRLSCRSFQKPLPYYE